MRGLLSFRIRAKPDTKPASPAKQIASPEQSLILPTPYEKLVKNIELKKRRGDLFRSIMSVFYYLRIILEMKYDPLTLENFEAAFEHMKKVAQIKNNDYSWQNFTKRGFFYQNDTSFDIVYTDGTTIHWRLLHPWHDNQEKKSWIHTYYDFDPDDKDIRMWVESGEYPYAFPPNMYELLDELCKKRHGSTLKEEACPVLTGGISDDQPESADTT